MHRFRCGVGYIGEGGDHCAGGAVTIPVAVPGALLAANGCVAHRPLPLAQVALSATGGAPIAPPSPKGKAWRTVKNRSYAGYMKLKSKGDG